MMWCSWEHVLDDLLLIYVRDCLYACAYMGAVPTEARTQVVVSHSVWMLEPELGPLEEQDLL